jgi:hypothetical protein
LRMLATQNGCGVGVAAKHATVGDAGGFAGG